MVPHPPGVQAIGQVGARDHALAHQQLAQRPHDEENSQSGNRIADQKQRPGLVNGFGRSEEQANANGAA